MQIVDPFGCGSAPDATLYDKQNANKHVSLLTNVARYSADFKTLKRTIFDLVKLTLLAFVVNNPSMHVIKKNGLQL